MIGVRALELECGNQRELQGYSEQGGPNPTEIGILGAAD